MKADVTLTLTQEVRADDSAMMILHIHNNTEFTLNLDALMTVPGQKGFLNTRILKWTPKSGQ